MSTPVTAAVLREKGGFLRFEELVLDKPRADEVLVRMVATGICQTDAHVRNQHIPSPMPIVLGHEGAGVIEEVGVAVTSVAPGDHVVLSYQSCGHCRSCWSGHPAYCDHAFAANFSGRRLDGTSGLRSREGEVVNGRFFGQSSFATYALASERNVVKVPNDLPLELLAPLGCGLQTGAGSILHALAVPSGASLVVFGVGAVGMAAIMAAHLAGAATVIAVDVHAERLAFAHELGATHRVAVGRDDNVATQIKKICSRGVDYVLDTSGHKDSLRAGLDVLAPGGRFGFVAFNQGSDASLQASSLFVGKALQGIIQGDAVPQRFIPELISFYRDGRFPFDRLVSFYDLQDIEQAFNDCAAGAVVKAVLRFPVAG